MSYQTIYTITHIKYINNLISHMLKYIFGVI
nr:MAG TPA: hypothetical protein [Caudoviricetes sp.]